MNLSTILVKTSCTVGVEPRKRQICVLNAAIWNCSRIVLSYCLKREHCSLVTRTPVSRTSLPKFNSINIFSVTRFPDRSCLGPIPRRLASCKAPWNPFTTDCFSESILVDYWDYKSSQWSAIELQPGLDLRLLPHQAKGGAGVPLTMNTEVAQQRCRPRFSHVIMLYPKVWTPFIYHIRRGVILPQSCSLNIPQP